MSDQKDCGGSIVGNGTAYYDAVVFISYALPAKGTGFVRAPETLRRRVS